MIYYTVRPGDTVYRLAARFNVPVNAILAANPGLYPYNLLVGQQIMIPVEQSPGQGSPAACIFPNELNLRQQLRKLWEEHVAWTRMTLMDAAAGSPGLEQTANRLLRNATDMADALRPLYGDANANRFGNLIHDHLTIALDLVNAAKAGNAQAAQEAEKKWYANADQIAQFLNSINPYIDREAFRQMLYTHLALTKDEATSLLNRDYARSIALYDQIQNQALGMADAMANGIVRQFPQLFR